MAQDAHLEKATVRFFRDDLQALRKIAAQKRSKWQIELRQLVHRALSHEKLATDLLRDR